MSGLLDPVAFLMPTTEGRQLAIRPTLHGEGVQLAVIGKRGGTVEATSIALGEIPSFLTKVDFMAELAAGRHDREMKRSRRERERRHQSALARNPWLRKQRLPDPHATYILRPR